MWLFQLAPGAGRGCGVVHAVINSGSAHPPRVCRKLRRLKFLVVGRIEEEEGRGMGGESGCLLQCFSDSWLLRFEWRTQGEEPLKEQDEVKELHPPPDGK